VRLKYFDNKSKKNITMLIAKTKETIIPTVSFLFSFKPNKKLAEIAMAKTIKPNNIYSK